MKKLSLLFFILMLGMGAFAQTTRYWSGKSTTTDNIDDKTNWWDGVNPNSGDHLVFDNTNGRYRAYSNYGNGSWFGNIMIKEGAGSIKFLGDNTYAYKFENNSENELFEIANGTIGNRLNSDIQINPVGTGGILVSGSYISLDGAKTLHFYGANTATINGEIKEVNGSSSVYVHDSKVILKSASTYTGTTTIDNLGVLEVQKDISSSEIIVKSGAKLIVNGTDVDVQKLTINSGGTVEVKAGKSLTVNGALNNNGTLNLLSDANGTATIITKGTVSAGTYNINQYLALPRRTWYMSSPVASASPTGMDRIKSYNEATNLWAAATLPMVVGKGYSVTPPELNPPTNILFTGALNTGEKTIELQKDGSTTQAGFNFVGNPYPSYIDWKAVVAETKNKPSGTSIFETGTMWYRSKIEGNFKFYTVDGAGVVVPGTPSSITAFIPPMQGFWVKTKADASTLYFEDNMRSHAGTGLNPSSNPLKAPAATQSELSLLRLQVSNGTNTDEAVIYSYANATDGYDFYDSPKMMNSDAAIPEIYTTLNNQPIVINVMNSLPLDTEIGLAFVPGDATSFSLRASEITNLPSDVKVILKDNTTSTETDLTDGVTVYNFTPATTTGDRFSVIFRSAGSTTAMKTYSGNGISVYSLKNGINVTVNAELNEHATVRVFNAVGQQLINQRLTNRSTAINGNFNPGVYVVKVSNGTTVTATQKIVIK